jgi:hypothetical protein
MTVDDEDMTRRLIEGLDERSRRKIVTGPLG